MKLYRSKDLPGQWIGEDEHSALMVWKAARGGWAKRTAFTGSKRHLEEVEPALARGSGWPGGGRGPAPRAGVASEKLGIRVAKHERERWQHAANEAGRSLSDWIRDTLNAAAPERSKAKP